MPNAQAGILGIINCDELGAALFAKFGGAQFAKLQAGPSSSSAEFTHSFSSALESNKAEEVAIKMSAAKPAEAAAAKERAVGVFYSKTAPCRRGVPIWQARVLGVFYAVAVGCFGGSMLVPLAFNEFQV